MSYYVQILVEDTQEVVWEGEVANIKVAKAKFIELYSLASKDLVMTYEIGNRPVAYSSELLI